MNKPTEHEIQCAIVDYLYVALPKSIRVVAVSNNPRSKVTGGREKARGMCKGFPDLILTGAFHGLIEVKREGSYLRPEQKEWAEWAYHAGVPHAVCRSIDDVSDTLAAWGIPETRAA